MSAVGLAVVMSTDEAFAEALLEELVELQLVRAVAPSGGAEAFQYRCGPLVRALLPHPEPDTCTSWHHAGGFVAA